MLVSDPERDFLTELFTYLHIFAFPPIPYDVPRPSCKLGFFLAQGQINGVRVTLHLPVARMWCLCVCLLSVPQVVGVSPAHFCLLLALQRVLNNKCGLAAQEKDGCTLWRSWKLQLLWQLCRAAHVEMLLPGSVLCPALPGWRTSRWVSACQKTSGEDPVLTDNGGHQGCAVFT